VTLTIMTLSITKLYHYAECRDLFIDMMSVVRLSVVGPNVVRLSVVRLNVVGPNVVRLSVVRLNVVRLSVVAADPIFRAEHKKVLQTLPLTL
jgi:hypothetical protein